MKQLKHYLHLYLGCDVQFPKSQNPDTNGVIKLTPTVLDDLYAYSEWVYCKPILRPLSDMTEEEKQQVGFDAYSVLRKSNSLPAFQEGKVWAAKQTVFLLSKHFDLFGLIDAGLAIDKTKLITPNTP